MVRLSRKLVVALAVVAAAAPASAANYGQSGDNSCVGRSISFFGPYLAGLFDILDLFGGTGVGEVASTHCDPSWD